MTRNKEPENQDAKELFDGYRLITAFSGLKPSSFFREQEEYLLKDEQNKQAQELVENIKQAAEEENTDVAGVICELDRQTKYSNLYVYQSLDFGTFKDERRLLYAYLQEDPSLLPEIESQNNQHPPVFMNDKLDEFQREAVVTVLSEPISLISGPPGTGKTTVILELMKQISDRGKTAAIVSQNNNAIDNIYSRINDKDSKYKELKSKTLRLGSKYHRTEEGFNKPISHKIFSKDIVKGWAQEETKEILPKHPLVLSTLTSLMKCFSDGDTYLYDYVIVDEVSQTNPFEGLIALACGKQVALFGDEKQLEPIYGKQEEISLLFPELLKTKAGKNIAAIMKNSRSIFHKCNEIFGTENNRILLRNHYRCHPAIADFINKVFYDNQLIVKTPRPETNKINEFPINVIWYNGRYSEKYFDETGKRGSRHNQKQLLIFEKEVFPSIVKELEENEDATFCVISPFKRQAEEVNEFLRFSAEKEDLPQEIRKRISVTDLNDVLARTVHKSQGREFDIVCFMPVDDYVEDEMWSQNDRLINVAISRAKQQFILITSSANMSTRARKSLKATSGRVVSGKGADPKKFNLAKLIDYVIDSNKNEELEQQLTVVRQTSLSSIFDNLGEPKDENQSNQSGIEYDSNLERRFIKELKATLKSEPEVRAVFTKLNGKSSTQNTYRISRIHPLYKEIYGAEDQIYGSTERRADFVITDEQDRVLLIVEVDGFFHRGETETSGSVVEQRAIDDAKKKYAESKGALVLDHLNTTTDKFRDSLDENRDVEVTHILLRLANDGSSFIETEDCYNGDPTLSEHFPLTLKDQGEEYLVFDKLTINKLLEVIREHVSKLGDNHALIFEGDLIDV